MAAPRELGALRHVRHGLAVRFDRRYDSAPAEVWAWLTEPRRLAGWLGVVELEPGVVPRRGARALLRPGDAVGPVDCTVSYCDPERMLEVAWRADGGPETEVVVEVVELAPGRTLLVLEHRGFPPETAADVGAGWHRRLHTLGALLDGAGPAQGTDGAVRQAYERALADLLAAGQ